MRTTLWMLWLVKPILALSLAPVAPTLHHGLVLLSARRFASPLRPQGAGARTDRLRAVVLGLPFYGMVGPQQRRQNPGLLWRCQLTRATALPPSP